jgi:two-component system LytT family sensor kinase
MLSVKIKSLRMHWWLWLSIFIGWALIGVAYAVNYSVYATHYVDIFGTKPDITEMLVWELPYWFLWAMLSPLVFWLTRRFRLERGRLLRNILFHVSACLTLSLVHRAVYLFIDWVLGVKVYSRLNSLSAVYQENFFFNLPNGFLCYVTILLAGTYYRHYQEEELKISRLKAERDQAQLQMTQAQLEALKMQLRPHFLFNTLNSISSLLDTNTKAAETMLARLGDFLRMTLDNSGTQEVTLQEEMKFLSCYLDIELERFSDRLTVQKEIARETYDALVPNLILQPIVENAIRHGIMAHVGDGRIEIRSRREDERLCLEVKDNGPGLHAGNGTGQRPKRGFGFALTRERLERLYGTSHSFSLSDAPEGGLRVLLEIPYHTSNATTNEGAALTGERVTDV